MSNAPVHPGEILAGKYQVEKVLGAGGMGVVVSARHLQLRERVALKFLLPDVMLQADSVERFDREARAAVRIKSEHVARVFDVGTLDSGVPYMVVEFLDGTDLAHWLEKRGAFAVPDAVDCVLQACEAMAEAHSLGIIHRDLKPSNLFVTRRQNGDPLIKVLDFGISKSLVQPDDAPRPSLTQTNGVIGSPLYMSPEQVRNAKTVDSRSDIWSLGVILYELIAASPPFNGRMVPEVIAKIAADPPEPIRNFRPDVEPALEQVILRALEKDPANRYASVADFAAALMPFGGPRAQMSLHRITANMPSLPPVPQLASSVSSSGANAVGVGTAETLTGASLRPTRGRATATLVGFGVLAAGIASVVAILVVRSQMPRIERPANLMPASAIESAVAPVPIASDAAAPAESAPPVACVAPPPTVTGAPPSKTQPASTGTASKSNPPAPPTTKGGIESLINDRR
ncbi:MAG: serine/threonine protein kinase [Deltaproteobacteria bacterium]|nr:serine/threonine protein kinase [Deltaproteobacteria bacterium]